jgi:hypothetical protein
MFKESLLIVISLSVSANVFATNRYYDVDGFNDYGIGGGDDFFWLMVIGFLIYLYAKND